MEYGPYLAVLRRRFVIIIALTLLGCASAGFFSLRQAKVYEASATLLINAAAPSQAIPYLAAALGNSGGQTQVQQLANTYSVYLKSSPFLSRVISSAHLATTPGTLAANSSSSLVDNTNFFTISAQAGTGAEAASSANAIARLFIEENLRVLQDQQAAASKGPNAALTKQILQELSAAAQLDDKLSRRPDALSPDIQARLATVEARINTLTTTYNQLVTAQSGSSGQALNTATLTGPATAPTVPILPTTKKNIIFGTVAGLVIALLLAFTLEYLDYAVRTPEDVEHATGQLPLATISAANGRRRHRSTGSKAWRVPTWLGAAADEGRDEVPAELYTIAKPRSSISEAFRTLRTNLAFSNLSQPTQTLVVTSVLPREGKTTVASNLAVMLAQAGKRVILVDADLRRPSIHDVFGVGKGIGFTDVLLSLDDLDAALQPSGTPNLQLLTSGALPSNPSELLSSEAIPHLIVALLQRTDMVIFDTPPMGAMSDALALSSQVEGTLLVVRSGAARPNVLSNGLDALRKVQGRPLGVVLNMVDTSTLRDNSYYYYYAQSGKYGETPIEVQGERADA